MMNEVAKVNQDLTTEDVMIHALQELKKLKEGQSILSADVDYLKNEQPVKPFGLSSVGKATQEEKSWPCSVVKTARQ